MRGTDCRDGTQALCISQFSDVYNSVQRTNAEVVAEITLFESRGGIFVNRYQEDGIVRIEDV